MRKLKKVLRILIRTIFIMLACTGLGMAGVIFPDQRHKRMDNQITIEQVDERRENEDGDEDEIK